MAHSATYIESLYPSLQSEILMTFLLKTLHLAGIACLLMAAGCVTGGDPVTSSGRQAETDASTSYYAGTHRVVVTYNDDTGNDPATIQYGPSTRTVLRGASLMGWSYSEDNGRNWSYGGKVAPPPGWAVLWGDPAITTSGAHYNMMFMSNLAMPDSKFPPAGISGSVIPALGGACIARSVDGGIHFQVFQCVSSTDEIDVGKINHRTVHHAYDGGSMASGRQGEVYASFVDLTDNQIVVWRSQDGNQLFQPFPSPFPGMVVASHPRIRVGGGDNTLFAMAAIAVEGGGFALYINSYRNGQWGTPRNITYVEQYPEVNFGTSRLGRPLTLRTGPQFSFDVGAASMDRDDSIRFLVTQRNVKGWLFVRGGICDYQLKSCGWYPGWTFGEAGSPHEGAQRLDVFNPNVSAFAIPFSAIGPRWQGTFVTRYGNQTTTVNLTRATLGYVDGMPFSIPVDFFKDMPVCPDGRGYWGDYDAFLPVQIEGDSVQFMRFTTDSFFGCTRRWQFVADRQHIRAAEYSY